MIKLLIFDILQLQTNVLGDYMFKTYQTKLKNDKILLKNNRAIPVYEYFHQNAQYFGMLERKLFVDLYVRKKPPGDIKK